MTPLMPTVEDLRAFAADGYFIVDRLFSPTECDEIVVNVEDAAVDLLAVLGSYDQR